jgi:hypothetical protein
VGYLLAIMCGVVCGVAAATPLFLQLRRGSVDIGRGFGAVIGAFLVIQLAMFALLAWRPALVAPFGVAAALAFLTVTVAGVLRR